jgi:hypothetical protein
MGNHQDAHPDKPVEILLAPRRHLSPAYHRLIRDTIDGQIAYFLVYKDLAL